MRGEAKVADEREAKKEAVAREAKIETQFLFLFIPRAISDLLNQKRVLCGEKIGIKRGKFKKHGPRMKGRQSLSSKTTKPKTTRTTLLHTVRATCSTNYISSSKPTLVRKNCMGEFLSAKGKTNKRKNSMSVTLALRKKNAANANNLLDQKGKPCGKNREKREINYGMRSWQSLSHDSNQSNLVISERLETNLPLKSSNHWLKMRSLNYRKNNNNAGRNFKSNSSRLVFRSPVMFLFPKTLLN